MILIHKVRQNTNHPDKTRRHPSRASCEIGGRRFEARGAPAIYKLCTLLWLHGHGGKAFEVHDDVSPFGKPGGLALAGKVRNWARFVKGQVTFDRQADPAPEFTHEEVNLIARAAGAVSDTGKIDSPAPGQARTARSRPSGASDPIEEGCASTGLAAPDTPEAA